MNCQDIKELLVPFLESDLSESQKAAVEVHLRTCADCQKEKMLLEKTWGLLDGLKAPVVSPNFTENVMAKIREQNQGKDGSAFNSPGADIQFVLLVFGGVIVSFGVIVGVLLFLRNQPIQEQPIATVVLPEQRTMTQVNENVIEQPKVIVPVQPKENVVEVVNPQVKSNVQAEVKRPVSDEDIIRNLDVYQNMEFYSNLPVINDLDLVQNLGAKGSVL